MPSRPSPSRLIESAAPGIDVADVVARVRQRIASLPERETLDLLQARANGCIDTLEAHANIADHKSQMRSQWPSSIGRSFPFNFARVRTAALSIFSFAFKDQYHVNTALVAALRDQIGLNRQIVAELGLLRATLGAVGSTDGTEPARVDRKR